MNRFLRALLLTPCSLLALVLSPGAITSQEASGWRTGAKIGVAAHGEQSHLVPVGIHLQGFAAPPVHSIVSAEISTSSTHFLEGTDHVHAPCRPGEDTFSCHRATSPAGFWRTTGGLLLSAGNLRFSGGGGTYHQYMGEERRSWHAGWYLGLEIPFNARSFRLHFDVQFHHLVGASFTPDWYLPVGIGLTF